MGTNEGFMQIDFGNTRSRDRNFTVKNRQKVDEFEPIYLSITIVLYTSVYYLNRYIYSLHQNLRKQTLVMMVIFQVYLKLQSEKKYFMGTFNFNLTSGAI